MSKTKNAYVKSRFSHDGTGYLKGAIIKGMAESQFNDWAGAELVREAMPEEVAAFEKKSAPEPTPPTK